MILTVFVLLLKNKVQNKINLNDDKLCIHTYLSIWHSISEPRNYFRLPVVSIVNYYDNKLSINYNNTRYLSIVPDTMWPRQHEPASSLKLTTRLMYYVIAETSSFFVTFEFDRIPIYIHEHRRSQPSCSESQHVFARKVEKTFYKKKFNISLLDYLYGIL